MRLDIIGSFCPYFVTSHSDAKIVFGGSGLPVLTAARDAGTAPMRAAIAPPRSHWKQPFHCLSSRRRSVRLVPSRTPRRAPGAPGPYAVSIELMKIDTV